jgi:DNA-binding transcriptional regulator YhcF (GntR family)
MEELHDESPRGKRNQTFTGDKLDWMSAVSHRKPSYFVIAFWIAQHISGRWREGFPSQQTLAELTGLSVPTVKRAVKWLEVNGWLNVKRERTYDHKARKYKTHNTYSLRMDNVQAALDDIAVLRHRRRLKGVTGDTSENVLRPDFKGVTGDTLTPSNKKEALEA